MEYDVGRDDDLTFAVVEAVSTHEGCRALSLPPLCDAVDPDALDDLFTPVEGSTTNRSGLVSFEYSNSHVTINPEDGITVVDKQQPVVTLVD